MKERNEERLRDLRIERGREARQRREFFESNFGAEIWFELRQSGSSPLLSADELRRSGSLIFFTIFSEQFASPCMTFGSRLCLWLESSSPSMTTLHKAVAAYRISPPMRRDNVNAKTRSFCFTFWAWV
ncbi:hypothetical protein L484_023927 [Morus notabilis]|uniref:Uncharacterized protein n=1 Tax=Morus notabilis TaxID=981085 RepID=W9RB06_9ROSA|nr:hypothetical protein L484_023927 [Morus notabilis]